ncbi:ssDNA-binding protein, mitochondrial [Lecanora helva]
MSFLLRRPLHLPLPPKTPLSLTHTHTHRPFTTTRPSHLARISIIGRLADTPELTPTSTGQDVVRYALGTSHGPRDNKQTSWWKVAFFPPQEGGIRDSVLGLGKGSLVYLEGEASMSKFTGKDGTPQQSLSIVQRNVEVLDRRDPRAEGQE